MSAPAEPVPVVGLLLAAGMGRRFDPQGRHDKLLARIAGTPVATRSARTLLAACGRVLAVVRPRSPELCEALAAGGITEFVECPQAEQGMGHSLACGARAAASSRPGLIVVALADMPWIQVATIRKLIAAARRPGAAGDQIVVAESAARRGHPVIFTAAHLPELGRCDGDRGAAALLGRYPVVRIPVDDPGVIHDIDRPEDLCTDDARNRSRPA